MSADWPAHFPVAVVAEAFGPRLAGYTIALEAWRRGLRVRFFDNHLRKYEISDSRRRIRFDKARPNLTTRTAVKIEQNKFDTATRLRAADVPTPESWVLEPGAAGVEDVMLDHAEAAGFPLVLKPLRGSMGRDVYTNLQNRDELVETFRHLCTRLGTEQKLVLEKHFVGEDYRVLVVGDRAVAACLRKPANVTADGESTVQQLIDGKNALRLNNPYLSKKLISRDRETDQHLRRLGYSYDSVPSDGEEVRLRSKANASQGGDSIDRTDALPDVIKDAAVRAVAAIPGLAIAGVDILYDADKRPVDESFRVIELNSRPEIEINMYPWEGEGQDAPRQILDVFFPESRRSSDPAVKSLVLNLGQILGPIRGASADHVMVKKRPDHNYPVRRIYRHSSAEGFTKKVENRTHLAARKAGISGHCGTDAEGSYSVVCGTRDQVEKFLRLTAKESKIDLASAQEWGGVVAQGFYFNY